jgi:hypothetical protein
MTAAFATFSLYYFVVCSAIGGVATMVTVKAGRARAGMIGAAIGAGLYIIQLPIWVGLMS